VAILQIAQKYRFSWTRASLGSLIGMRRIMRERSPKTRPVVIVSNDDGAAAHLQCLTHFSVWFEQRQQGDGAGF
jgi:hypothetical protein